MGGEGKGPQDLNLWCPYGKQITSLLLYAAERLRFTLPYATLFDAVNTCVYGGNLPK
jgi:hypothetical protein